MHVNRGARWFGVWFELSSVQIKRYVKLTTFLFASMVIVRLFLLNTLHISFLSRVVMTLS